ncbi:purine or other phosphorylase family 1 [Maridesulfovibrio hydrothermalis]|uniref:Purine or other phosphorylase family 1 n=1 Tax=Maridesulfovibrio hydrothermalis AM13 = DSM 14728 TaxID=1121451 RepID=L0R9C4_9BACT|nr:purine or other phosphorylase family 1 [Maridesulfovibrio hydrothermalis]CCO22186.1 Purine or other phosphorylase family 1 [Maridesulfovibrio hydrothermalis AM13 = DSM 14728]
MTIKTIGIVAAMEQEAQAACPSGERGTLGEFESLSGTLESGIKFTCIISGIGIERAGRAAKILCAEKPDLLMSIGVSGGLAPGLSAGNLVAATTIHSDISDFKPWHENDEDALMRSEIIPLCGKDIQCGRLITTEKPVLTPQDKVLMHDRTGAIAVDMESIAVAQTAATEKIPFACVRAVSDGPEKSIPAESLAGIDKNGKTHLKPVLQAILKRPSLILELIPMGMDYSKALKGLKKILK